MVAADNASLLGALSAARALLQADGADVRLVNVSHDGAVSLELLIADASCAECVMPRAVLEDIFLKMLRNEVGGLSSVSISDPREGVGWPSGGHA